MKAKVIIVIGIIVLLAVGLVFVNQIKHTQKSFQAALMIKDEGAQSSRAFTGIAMINRSINTHFLDLLLTMKSHLKDKRELEKAVKNIEQEYGYKISIWSGQTMLVGNSAEITALNTVSNQHLRRLLQYDGVVLCGNRNLSQFNREAGPVVCAKIYTDKEYRIVIKVDRASFQKMIPAVIPKSMALWKVDSIYVTDYTYQFIGIKDANGYLWQHGAKSSRPSVQLYITLLPLYSIEVAVSPIVQVTPQPAPAAKK